MTDEELTDPAKRFELIGFMGSGNKAKGIVFDQRMEEELKVSKGDSLDEYRVLEVNIKNRSMAIKAKGKSAIELKQQQPPRHHSKRTKRPTTQKEQ